MPAPYKGACLCGAVTFSISSEPAGVLTCFCDHCSKNAGAPFQVLSAFKGDDISISGKENLTEYAIPNTTSGKSKPKQFCAKCGANLWTMPETTHPNWILRNIYIEGGEHFKPQVEFFTKNRPAWMSPCEGAKQWETTAAPS